MATASRRQASTVRELALHQHARVNVFQLLRMLTSSGATALPPEQRLRFRADLSGAFPGTEFSRVRAGAGQAGDEVIEIRTANYCLASVLGPMPEPYTEWVRDLEREREPAMADFLDIFNHRLNLLRYELKEAQQIALNNKAPERTAHAHALGALMGVASPAARSQMPLPARAWLGLAGLLANSRRSAAAVAQVLALYLGAQVRLEQFVGAWRQLDRRDLTVLGRQRQCLGRSAVLGQRVWDQQARVRLHIATIDYARLCQLLPPNMVERLPGPRTACGGSAYPGLVAMVHLLLDRQVDCEIALTVNAPRAPYTLAARSDGPAPLRLAHTAWLRARSVASASERKVSFLIPAREQAGAAA